MAPHHLVGLLEPPVELHLADLDPRRGERRRDPFGVGGDRGLDRQVTGTGGEGDAHAGGGLEGGRQRRGRGQRAAVARVRARHRVRHQRRVGDGAGERAGVLPGLGVRGRLQRHAAVRRLVADDAGERGGHADRPADVGAGGERRGARGERRRGAAGGAADALGEVPGVAGRPPPRRVGHRHAAELGSGGAGVDDRPRRAQALQRPGGLGRGGGVERLAQPFAHPVPGQCLGLLGGHRQTLQRAGGARRPAALGLARLDARALEQGLGERVDRGLDLRGALDQRLQQLDRRERPAPRRRRSASAAPR